MYIFTASVPAYDRIVLRRSDTLEGLADAEETVIWIKHDSGIMSTHIWAPEIHYINGRWFIYFAAGDKDDIWAIRPYVLGCKGEDPINDAWADALGCSVLMKMTTFWIRAHGKKKGCLFSKRIGIKKGNQYLIILITFRRKRDEEMV